MRLGLSLLVHAFLLTGAHAQNQHSLKYMSFTETQQKAVWTLFLQRSGERCDRVVRAMFQGGTPAHGDTWSVGCSDGNEYSVGIAADTAGSTRLMTCKELIAADLILSKGKPDPKMRCWVKWN
jgi:hypothetical protein